MTIILAGAIGRSGLGGQAWAYLQYLIGFRALGYEVYYLEDCGETSWVWNWDTGEWTEDPAFPATYVRECLEPFGFKDRWIYRTSAQSFGMSLNQLKAVCAQADLLVMRAIPLWDWRPEYALPKRRIFIDVDPGFTQMNIASGDTGLAAAIGRCDRLFTLGQRFGAADCLIPETGGPWLKTVPPVALSEWPCRAGSSPGTHFTSIMRWDGFQDAKYDGKTYGQKDQEFARFIDLPRQTRQKFRIALNGPETLAEYGWEIVPGEIATRTPQAYRQFIQQSRAEFGVAKQGYVKMRGGWFSDRSVCYLASGLPLLIQDTGLSDWLPVGEGVITFHDLPGILRGIEAINADYDRHRVAARRLAEEYFSTEKVLPALLQAAMS
jgi:hypothetical protein